MKLTKAQKKFIELDRHKETVKQFFDEYQTAVYAVLEELSDTVQASDGVEKTFTDEEGIIYKTTIPKGRFVYYEQFAILHTKRPGETKGTLSQEEASRITAKVKEVKKK